MIGNLIISPGVSTTPNKLEEAISVFLSCVLKLNKQEINTLKGFLLLELLLTVGCLNLLYSFNNLFITKEIFIPILHTITFIKSILFILNMEEVYLYTFISVLIVSLISFIGILTLSIKEKKLNKILILFVSFSAGALIAGAMVHLIPEAFKEYGANTYISLSFLAGILTFFLLEKFLCWRHCHVPAKKHKYHIATMNLVGDFFHNIIDGMVIAGCYLVNINLGLTTTLAVILHEIPQEIGDFGVLLYSGLSKYKALFYNFLSALSAILGAIVILSIGNTIPNFSLFLLPFTAGGFIYIAGSDLIPELHKEFKLKSSFYQFLFLVLGMLVMYGFTFLE